MLDAGLARVGSQIQPVARSTRIGGIGIESLTAVAASDPPGPPARSNFGTVLSANEKAVYVIGGTLAWSGELQRTSGSTNSRGIHGASST